MTALAQFTVCNIIYYIIKGYRYLQLMICKRSFYPVDKYLSFVGTIGPESGIQVYKLGSEDILIQ